MHTCKSKILFILTLIANASGTPIIRPSIPYSGAHTIAVIALELAA